MGTLSEHGIRNNFNGACQAINRQLDRLSQDEVKRKLISAANAALTSSGVPTVGMGSNPGSGANAMFDFTTWSIVFGGPLSGKRLLTQKFFVNCANTVYHEARHCEQWFRMAQAVARGFDHISNQDLFLAFQGEVKRDAQTIGQKMWLHPNAAAAAVANSNYAPVRKDEIQKWWRSIYAVNRNRRGHVLEHISEEDNYDKYRNLAEEVDAWRCGDGLGEELKAAIGLRDDRPSYRDWKILTKGQWFQYRSGDLKDLDQAYERYESSRSAPDLASLKTAFQSWYGPKGGNTIRNKLDEDGVGVVDRLRTFLGA